jgi:hypothetical protein
MTRKKSTVSRWRWSKHFILCTSIYWICTILVSLHFSEYISLILNSSLTVAYFLDFSSNSSTPRSRAMQSTQAAQDPAEGWRVSDCKPRKEQSLSKGKDSYHTVQTLYTYLYNHIYTVHLLSWKQQNLPLGISWDPFDTGPRSAQSAGFTEAIAAPPAMLASPEVMASEASFNKFLPRVTR